MAKTLKVKNIDPAEETITFDCTKYMVEDMTLAYGETKLIYNDKEVWCCPFMEDLVNDGKVVLISDDVEKSKGDSLSLVAPSYMLDTAKI